MKLEMYITADPKICHGQPCFKGTRILVHQVLELLEAGETPAKILKSYPALKPGSIRAALHLAVRLMKMTDFEDRLDEMDASLVRDASAARREFQTGRSTVWKAFRGLTKSQRQVFLEQLLREKAYREDLLDLALIEARRHEPSRPYREYLAERTARRVR